LFFSYLLVVGTLHYNLLLITLSKNPKNIGNIVEKIGGQGLYMDTKHKEPN